MELIEKNNLKFDTLCHNDLNMGNIMKVSNNVYFIDFEFSCLNDPLLEIARFFYCTKYYYYYNFPLDYNNLWTKQKKLEFLQYYYKTKKVSFLQSKLIKIDSLIVITNYFNFLLGLKWVRQPQKDRAIRRYKSMRGHFEKIKENGNFKDEEVLILTDFIEFLKPRRDKRISK